MKEVLQFFNGDNIVAMVVGIGTTIITSIVPYITNHFNQEKQWKYSKEKSSSEKFHRYFVRMFIVGLIFGLLYMPLIIIITEWFDISLSIDEIKKICCLITFATYIILFFSMKPESELIFLKKKCKYEEELNTIFYKIPIVLFGIFWTGIWLQHNLIMRIIFIVVLIFEIIYLAVLENERKSKYQYAKFYFYQGEPICNVDASNIRQDGKWIICVNKNLDKEYRFRINDVQKVEYSERFNGESKICLPNSGGRK